jgi:alpha-mannosidase
MENQTLPLGVVSLFAGSGARYSWKGICGCDTQIYTSWDREHEIYWWTGLDGSRLLLKWNSMLGDMPELPGQYSQGMGGYAEARYPNAVVDYVDSDPDFIARYPYNVIGAFGHGWDDLQTQTDEFVTTAQSKSNAERQVIVSNELDFFLDFETAYGNSIPSKSVSFGNEWDLYCAALAEVSARVKRAVEKLRGIEALAALVSLDNPNFMSSHEIARNQAWINLGLYWEHNFGMSNPPSQLTQERIAWQKRLAGEIENYVENLALDAKQSFGSVLQISGQDPKFYVFNPLSWSRSDYCDILWTGSDLVHVVDLSTNLEMPSQIVTLNGSKFLRVFVENIPAVGYKVLEVRSGIGSSFPDAASVNGNVIENDFYKLDLADRGAMISLVDKQRGNREFVQSGEFINDLGPSSGALQLENAGPVTVTILATAPNPLNHTTRITLIRNLDRIEIQNDINQNFQDNFTWEYSFAINNPDIWHEEVGAVLNAKKVSQGGHYSDRVINTRYDWLTLNHFADVSDGSVGVTLSNADCYFMRVGNSTVDNLDTTLAKISVLAGGRVVNGTSGLPNQGGDSHFMQRFALQTHGNFDSPAAMRFALEHQNPLVTGQVTGGGQYPGDTYSFISLSNPDVLLWALKPHEDGIENGVVTRLWNLSSNTQSFELHLADGPIVGAHHLSHIETPVSTANIQNGALKENLSPHQMKTFAVSLTSLPAAPSPTPTPPPNPDNTGCVFLPFIKIP